MKVIVFPEPLTYTLPETNRLPLQIGAWKMILFHFPPGMAYFSGASC